MSLPKLQFPADRAERRYTDLIKMMQISAQMTEKGWRVNREAIVSHQKKAQINVEIYTEKFLALSGLLPAQLGNSGTGQTKRVREWFLLDQVAPVVSRDKQTRQPQVNTAALIEYATRFSHTAFGPAAAALYGLRKNKKALEFCKAYDYLSRGDGRIHSSFFPFGTKTGRWSSSAKLRVTLDTGETDTLGCNIQQVPAKEPTFDFGEGPVKLVHSLRDIFIADKGCEIHSYDYEALELRLIAYVYGVRGLIDNLDKDPHWTTARHLFAELRLPAKPTYVQVGDKMVLIPEHKKPRDAAKSCAYAISYSMHDPRGKGKYPTLYKTLKADFPDMPEATVNVLAERFFKLYPEIKAGQLAAKQEVSNYGYKELPINGRRLYYPDSTRGWNQALNFMMQGTGAELINRATMEIAYNLGFEKQSYLLAQVHDELVLNVHIDHSEYIDKMVLAAMSRPVNFGKYTAGIPGKVTIGPCWPK